MNIVIINNLPRFPDSPRWDFELVTYQDQIDHAANTISYIVNPRGRSGVTAPDGSHRLYTLDTLSDIAAYRPVFAEIMRAFGQIDRLVVFSESLQDVAAQLRDEFQIPGNGVEANRLGRDKLVMKQRVAAAGLRVPRFAEVVAGQTDCAVAFANMTGYPLILKPINGLSSSGVKKIADEPTLRAAIAAMSAGQIFDLEEFIQGRLFHVDGLINAAGEVTFIVPSEYFNTCLDFTLGAPLGASMIDSALPLYQEICTFTTLCLKAIGLKDCPFHLELFLKDDEELVFLEVGARVGGADVPYVIHKTCGINLFGEWLRMIVGNAPASNTTSPLFGGWLMFPRPEKLPARVEMITDFAGKIDTLYRQLIPQCGDLLQHEEGYSSMQSGRFLFCSDSAERVRDDMATVIREFSVVTTQP